jgi:hypothetical protein
MIVRQIELSKKKNKLPLIKNDNSVCARRKKLFKKTLIKKLPKMEENSEGKTTIKVSSSIIKLIKTSNKKKLAKLHHHHL